jgi:hypothetical protein
MVKRYGDGAATEAAMRADEFLDQKPYPKRVGFWLQADLGRAGGNPAKST